MGIETPQAAWLRGKREGRKEMAQEIWDKTFASLKDHTDPFLVVIEVLKRELSK